MAWRTVNALDPHGGSLKPHPAQIKPPSLPTRIGPEQTNFRRHAAATGPTPWVAKASSTSNSENRSTSSSSKSPAALCSDGTAARKGDAVRCETQNMS